MTATGKLKTTVWRWQERFMHSGVEGLLRNKPPPAGQGSGSRGARRGRGSSDSRSTATRGDALGGPRHGQDGWSGGLDGAEEIWKAHGLAPHRCRQFKLSTDRAFASKLRDIVGLYVDPPAHPVVLSIDKKSQIQVLDRTQPGLPLKAGRGTTLTHDYERHGSTTLFASLNILDGSVVGRTMQRHRHQEFVRFLNALERDIPVGKVVHVIRDNYAAHKHEKVRAWLDRHSRWTFHFTPTSGSWLNAVEGFFAKLTRRRLKRGVFGSTCDLQATITRYIAEHHNDPKPFIWKADPDDIIAARNRGFQALESVH